MMNLQTQHAMLKLLRDRRWAALATQGSEGPEVSWVAYASEPDFSGFLLHLSTLAAHTRNLLAHPCAGLAISALERDEEDPQTLARVTMQGAITVISQDHADYSAAAQLYQERLPASIPRFAFTDFLLLRLIPTRIRFVGGFAQAYSLDHTELQAAAQCTN